jgi:soluble P-type ATPase
MIEIYIPGFKDLRLDHLVLDYNGTIGFDGKLIPGVNECIVTLSRKLSIHVLTADTFGSARVELDGLPCKIVVIPGEKQNAAKLDYIRGLNPQATVCIGNGRNDRLMLKEAALGIAVIQEEGASSQAVMAADVVCSHIMTALELLANPLRLVATLRS